jgi:hypothetical protein
VNKTLRLLGCAVRLLLSGLAGNWPEYDRVCAEIDAIHTEEN